MKRSALVRKTPLRAKTRLESRSKLVTKRPLARVSELKRTAMKRKAPKVRAAERGGDAAYLTFVRSLPCCVYGAAAPSHAHHEIGGGRGKGQKAPDTRTMPLSFRAHREFHDGTGFCKGWSVEKRMEWQSSEIDRVRAIWLEFVETGVIVEPQQIAI